MNYKRILRMQIFAHFNLNLQGHRCLSALRDRRFGSIPIAVRGDRYPEVTLPVPT